MFDKEVDITKTYGSKVIKKVPRSSIMRKAATGYKKKYTGEKATISQLKQIYALQKDLGMNTTWNTTMKYSTALKLIDDLTFKKYDIMKRPNKERIV